jgi:4-oxalocrotonate tautomerase family enzyme
MPFIIIYNEEGGTEEQKQRVCTDITFGISKHFNIPEQAVRIIFQEPKENQMSYSGWLKSSPEYKAKKAELQNTKSNTQLVMPLVILYTEEGKTEEQYQETSKDITLAISKHFNIPEQAVRIIFQELKENRIASGGLLESSPEYKAKKKLAETQITKVAPR